MPNLFFLSCFPFPFGCAFWTSLTLAELLLVVSRAFAISLTPPRCLPEAVSVHRGQRGSLPSLQKLFCSQGKKFWGKIVWLPGAMT